MKKIALFLSIGALATAPLFALTRLDAQEVKATSGYVIETNGCRSGGSTLPTKICLSPVEEEDVRNYYSSLFNLGSSELSGQNLLKNLRPILFEMNYYPYGTINSGGVSQIYTITERDWANSPASTIASGTFNQAGDTITGFDHATEKDNNPYIHMLYVDYSIEPTTRYLNDTGTAVNFDKEHVWCQSRGFKASSGANGPAGTDLHHLIAGDHDVNSAVHSDRPYGYVKNATKSGARTATASNVYGSILHTSQEDESAVVFEPQDSDKGDIARAIFYMAARYNNLSKHNTITQFEANLTLANYATAENGSVISDNDNPVAMGILRDLLAWNKLDPVDEFEIHRNDLIYRNYQGNRNPFIDFPQWADYIWGTTDGDGTNYNPTPTGSADPQNDTVYYTGGEDVSVTGVNLNKANLSLDLYNNTSETLVATVLPNNATNKGVTWSSNNTSVATVSNTGLVTAKSTGNATITVTTVDGGFSATCAVTVTNSTPTVTSVTLNKTSHTIDLFSSSSVTLSATVNGTNNPSQSVSWSSSNTSVATVNSSGKVSALRVGSATITATSTFDNTKSASCLITVVDTTPVVTGVTLNETSIQLDVDRENEKQLSATVEGVNGPSQSVTWTSADSDIATVSSGGLVTGIAPGETTITATSVYDPSFSTSCDVTVIDSSIGVDVITNAKLGFTSGDSGYTTKTGISDTTTATYTVHSFKNNDYIQFNGTATAGLISSSSAGYLKKVTVDFNTKTSVSGDGRTVEVYASKTAYSAISDLYSSETRGTLVGSSKYATNNKTPSFDIDLNQKYKYVGIIVTGGAAYFDSFSITWKDDGSYVAPTGVSLDANELELDLNETYTLIPTVAPNNATNQIVTWSTSDPHVAYIDQTGKIYAISEGTATITVDTNDKHFQATCTVTVNGSSKYKVSPYKDGVAYKMYLENTGYFNGEGAATTGNYYCQTDASYSNAVDVYFETVGNSRRIYFYNSNSEKKYIIAYDNFSNNKYYCNIGVRDESIFTDGETTIFDWQIDLNGHLYVMYAHGENTPVSYTPGLKTSDAFKYTTFAMNLTSNVNRFIRFEYTAESFASDFLDKITCDDSGVNSPIYATGYGWNDFKNIFDSLAGSQQDILADAVKSETGTIIQKALARYEYMVWKYHYTDFLGRDVPLSSGLTESHSISYSSNVALVVIIAISITTIGGALLVIKKKHE